ncbi:MAG: DUF1015 family protein [Myxococcaceae bacterium]|nr:DUF1015 family protein [Myxococcaceae bacterium]
MAILDPLCTVRPDPALAAKISVPPYDVVSSAEARVLSRAHPDSFFRVSRPEVGLPEGTDEHSDAAYAKGREALVDLLGRGVLRRDSTPRYLVYRQTWQGRTQTGVVAGASVAAFADGRIKKHELTRADKEDDRTRHVDVLGGNDEPVFFAFRARADVAAVLQRVQTQAPEVDFTSDDGVGHTLWPLSSDDTRALGQALGALEVLYIADGHHRSAAASRVNRLRVQRGAKGTHDRMLAVAFPHDQLRILPYNRLVKDLGRYTPATFLQALGQHFTVSPGTPTPRRRHTFSLYLSRTWHQLEAKSGSFPETPTGSLDVAILQQNVLQALLGIGDPRTDQRIDFVGGIRGTAELEKRVDAGGWAAAISMFPTSLEELFAVADAGEIMPPKSTWFEPKLRSGLFLHLFEP